jgi:RIO-like serine/threonine protein kinase
MSFDKLIKDSFDKHVKDLERDLDDLEYLEAIQEFYHRSFYVTHETIKKLVGMNMESIQKKIRRLRTKK